jgi:hypothetical protein
MHTYCGMSAESRKRRRLLGYSKINRHATMEYFMTRNVNNRSTYGKDVFCAVRAESYVMQQ